jgi:hypothetical protein
MRAIPIAAIAFAGLFLSSIGARADGTWCAQYGGGGQGGATNCGFYSFQQCQAARWGNAGFATKIRSRPTAMRDSRSGTIGATVKLR